MGNVIKNVRGTSDEHASYIGEKGVISLVTNENYEPTGEIRIHDGKTPGGINPIPATPGDGSAGGSSYFSGMRNVQQAFKSDSWATDSNDFVDIPGLEVTITPESADSEVFVMMDLMVNASWYCGEVQLVRNGEYIAQADEAGVRPRSTIIIGIAPSSDGYSQRSSANFLDKPNTTEPVTYKLVGRGRKDDQNNGALYINRTDLDRDTNTFDGRGISSLTVIEVNNDSVPASSGSSATTTEIDAITSDVSDVANNLSTFEDRFVGMIASFAMETPPAGWHVCNGGEYSITSYSELYAAIGTTWGDLTDGSGGSGDTHFRVPDLRGEFLRGFDNASGTDPDAASRTGGDAVGSSQGNNIRSTMTKSHSPYDSAHSGKTIYFTSSGATWGAWDPDITFQGASYSFRYGPLNSGYVTTLTVGSGTDTRPINKAVQYCIKY